MKWPRCTSQAPPWCSGNVGKGSCVVGDDVDLSSAFDPANIDRDVLQRCTFAGA
jgi:hypothetical protein